MRKKIFNLKIMCVKKYMLREKKILKKKCLVKYKENAFRAEKKISYCHHFKKYLALNKINYLKMIEVLCTAC